mgnify:CR=1 FL=1
MVSCRWAKEGRYSSKGQGHLHQENTGAHIEEPGDYQVESWDYEAEQKQFGLLKHQAQVAASSAAIQLQQQEDENQSVEPKTLYVVNLNSSITEDLIVAMFGQVGGVKSCRIIREPGYDPHCFVEYEKHSEAKCHEQADTQWPRDQSVLGLGQACA